ncbi:TPA: hypothetical protein ACOEF8_004112 [Enterobacter roggenkampii]
MKSVTRYFLVSVYCVFGLTGWYKYSEFSSKSNSQVVYDHLSPEMTVSYVRAIVWYHSRGKLEELRSILDDKPEDNEAQTRIRISNMLRHRSAAYIRELNSLDTPVSNLGNWYERNFKFDKFLDDIFLVCFNKKYSVEEKIRYVSDVMEEYQNTTNEHLMSVMNNERNK